MGHFETAERLWRKAIEIDPENRIARNNVSRLDRERGRAAELRKWEELARKSEDARSLQRDAKAAKEAEDYAKGAALYLRVSELDHGNRNMYRTGAAACLQRLGEGERAEVLLLGVLVEEPRNTYALNALAALLLSRREPERAQRILMQVLELRPNDKAAWATLARVYSEMGRKDDAVEAFRLSGIPFDDGVAS